ncbi:hypothetical protein [Streptomyces sp. NPDC086777]|uniref:hypothetical protein n=1 Tax=Streptomyces sp. NPDC086777 TaxID=3154866 RepID=UPI003450CD90
MLDIGGAREAVSGTMSRPTALMLALLVSVPVALVTHWASVCRALLPAIRIGPRGLPRPEGARGTARPATTAPRMPDDPMRRLRRRA